jgi:hypothetical protein
VGASSFNQTGLSQTALRTQAVLGPATFEEDGFVYPATSAGAQATEGGGLGDVTETIGALLGGIFPKLENEIIGFSEDEQGWSLRIDTDRDGEPDHIIPLGIFHDRAPALDDLFA